MIQLCVVSTRTSLMTDGSFSLLHLVSLSHGCFWERALLAAAQSMNTLRWTLPGLWSAVVSGLKCGPGTVSCAMGCPSPPQALTKFDIICLLYVRLQTNGIAILQQPPAGCCYTARLQQGCSNHGTGRHLSRMHYSAEVAQRPGRGNFTESPCGSHKWEVGQGNHLWGPPVLCTGCLQSISRNGWRLIFVWNNGPTHRGLGKESQSYCAQTN